LRIQSPILGWEKENPFQTWVDDSQSDLVGKETHQPHQATGKLLASPGLSASGGNQARSPKLNLTKESAQQICLLTGCKQFQPQCPFTVHQAPGVTISNVKSGIKRLIACYTDPITGLNVIF
jgi:hypothetical protein